MGYNQRIKESMIKDFYRYIAISARPHRTYRVVEAQHILGYYLYFRESDSINLCIQHEFIGFFSICL